MDPEDLCEDGLTCSLVYAGCKIVFFGAIPIAQIAVGTVYLNDCPQQHYIPIYLVVSGVFSLTLVMLSFFCCNEDLNDDWEGVGRLVTLWNTLATVFLFCWFITGNIWIYSIYPPNYNQTVPLEPYCNKTLYHFAFWTTTLLYILLGFLLIVLLAICCFYVVQMFKENTEEEDFARIIADVESSFDNDLPTVSYPSFTESLEEWRALRQQQDDEYSHSVMADQQRALRQEQFEAYETRRKQVIEARKSRMSSQHEPEEGVMIQFKFPNGAVKRRRFHLSEPIQVLFDFVGSDDLASELFMVQKAMSPSPLESTLCGTIEDLDITGPSTLFVQWLSWEDVEHRLYEQNNPLLSAADPPPHPQWLVSVPSSRTQSSPTPAGPRLPELLAKLHSNIKLNSSPASNQINVCRNNILECCLQAFKRPGFDPGAKLDIIFIDLGENGEGAVDEGGPTREFIRLFMSAIHQSRIFEGPEESKTLALDTHALEVGLYKYIAQMICVAVAHGGVGPRFFSTRLYLQICGKPTPPVALEEVGDHTLREKLAKIKQAQSIEEARFAVEEASESLLLLGALRFVKSLEDRDALVQSAANFYVEGRIQVAFKQFMEGFQTLGLGEILRTYSRQFEGLFTHQPRPLKAKDLISLFKVVHSRRSRSKKAAEKQTIIFWKDWLREVERGECEPVTLEKVLVFASGASTVPPLGFPHPPLVEFLHPDGHTARRIFPEANTCRVILRLPIHTNYRSFKENMESGILQAPTFGES